MDAPTMTQHTILDTLHHFKEEKQTEYRILRLGVFGSVARDQFSEDSDVDVVVELERPDLFVLISIKQDLEELLERAVDVVHYRERMNTFLKKRIQQEAVYV